MAGDASVRDPAITPGLISCCSLVCDWLRRWLLNLSHSFQAECPANIFRPCPLNDVRCDCDIFQGQAD